jgi:hypothetical protein
MKKRRDYIKKSMEGGKFKRYAQRVNTADKKRTNDVTRGDEVHIDDTPSSEKLTGCELKTTNTSKHMTVVTATTYGNSSADVKDAIDKTPTQEDTNKTDKSGSTLDTSLQSNTQSGDVMSACGFNRNVQSNESTIESVSVKSRSRSVSEHKPSNKTTDQHKVQRKQRNPSKKTHNHATKSDMRIKPREITIQRSSTMMGNKRFKRNVYVSTDRPENKKDTYFNQKTPRCNNRARCRSTPRQQHSTHTPAFNSRGKSPFTYTHNYQQNQFLGQLNYQKNISYNDNANTLVTRY